MNPEQSLQAIFGAPGQPKNWALPLGPGRWHVLFAAKARPLLVPAGAEGIQHRFLPYFAGGWKGLYAQVMLRMNAAFPRAGLLPELRSVEGGHGFFLDRQLYGRALHKVIQIGTAGPHQTASVLLVSERGEGVTLARIAMVPSADNQLVVEAKWLRELEAAPELENQIPRLLAEGNAPNGRRYLVTNPAPANCGTGAFTPAHAAFLGALGRVGWDVTNFEASPCFKYLESTLGTLDPYLTSAMRATLHAGLRDCRAHLDGWSGPFVVAHGDFAPWNIRVNGERLFVFDWEYARAGANPLADTFNYLLISRAESGRGLSPALLASTLRRVETVARQLYPEWTWRARVISALGLAYLIEAFLHHAVASRGFARTPPVMASYLRLMDQRSAWMA